MYTALYRRWRPETFDEMAGQQHIIKILKNQIKTGNIGHAYLFCGTRGTGKTTAARIFAKGVNCLSDGEKPCGVCENCESIQNGTFFDVIEIDAASNNGVENIRELRESVKYPPAAGLCKVYIIDEVHMLSGQAFNALLKTLEEPPEHVIFIMATTEPHKLPATVLSRCLRLDFRRVPEAEIIEKLREICLEMNIKFEDGALALIASNGDGSVRDALSILEQCLPPEGTTLSRSEVVEILGTAGEEIFIEMSELVSEGKVSEALFLLEKISRDGKDLRQFTKDWIYHFRNLMMSKYADKLENIMNLSCENAEKVKAQGDRFSLTFISEAIVELSKTANAARWSTQPRILLELSIVKLATPSLSESTSAMLCRLEKLEDLIESGDFVKSKPEKIRKEVSDIKIEKDMTVNEVGAEVREEVKSNSKPDSAKEIWRAALAEILVERPSFNMLNKGVKAVGITENQLTIKVDADTKKMFLNQNREIIEKKILIYAKSPLKLNVIVSESEEQEKVKSEEVDQTIAAIKQMVDVDKLVIVE